MSVIDKVVAAVTPLESDEQRVEARNKARSVAQAGGWLDMVLDHHVMIEAAFAAVKSASTPGEQSAAQKELARILTGHAIAEEAAIYPVMALTDQKRHAGEAYLEQSMTKIQLGALEDLTPMTQDFLDKLEHIRGAVLHHVYEEESSWLVTLHQEATPAVHAKLSLRYQQEFGRYMGASSAATASVAQ